MSLLNDIKKVIYDDPNTPHQLGHDPGGLIGGIENLFGQYGDKNRDQSVRQASQDHLDAPGAGGRNVRPASEHSLHDVCNSFKSELIGKFPVGFRNRQKLAMPFRAPRVPIRGEHE